MTLPTVLGIFTTPLFCRIKGGKGGEAAIKISPCDVLKKKGSFLPILSTTQQQGRSVIDTYLSRFYVIKCTKNIGQAVFCRQGKKKKFE